MAGGLEVMMVGQAKHGFVADSQNGRVICAIASRGHEYPGGCETLRFPNGLDLVLG